MQGKTETISEQFPKVGVDRSAAEIRERLHSGASDEGGDRFWRRPAASIDHRR